MNVLDPHFKELEAKVKIPASTLAKQLTEIIVDISGIKGFIDAIILPLNNFQEVLEKQTLNGLNKLENKSIFDHLVNKYTGELEVGIDIPLE